MRVHVRISNIDDIYYSSEPQNNRNAYQIFVRLIVFARKISNTENGAQKEILRIFNHKRKQYTATILCYSFHTHTPTFFCSIWTEWWQKWEKKGKPETKIHKYSFWEWAQTADTERWKKECAQCCPLMRIKCHFLYWIYCRENDLRSCVSETIESQCCAVHTAEYSEQCMASVDTAACVNVECRRNNRYVESIPCDNKKMDWNRQWAHDTSLHLLPHSKHINYVNTSSISWWMDSNKQRYTLIGRTSALRTRIRDFSDQ